jgi:hypothetical protein
MARAFIQDQAAAIVDALMQNHSTRHPTRDQYLDLAKQCDALATAATNKGDRRDYRKRAELWRRLAGARLCQDHPEKKHFAPRRMLNDDTG